MTYISIASCEMGFCLPAEPLTDGDAVTFDFVGSSANDADTTDITRYGDCV